jgi:molybdenum cofactor biosynthesis protein MoaC
MNEITSKQFTLRKAVATATVSVSARETIIAVLEKRVPKGDVFEFSRAAGLLGIKRTSDMIPDCHPLPVEFAKISFSIADLSIIIDVEVHTVYKTGVEVEAMHGASVTALTIYDMLKPIDKNVEITAVRLRSKSGGKSGRDQHAAVKCAVIVCSDSIASGVGEDKSGKEVIARLERYNITGIRSLIVPDDEEAIRAAALHLKEDGFRLAVFVGGTGASPRDNTPDALRPLLTRALPGLMEHARSYGQQRTPYSMLSRGIAGFFDELLIITAPGSVNGASETIDALFPAVLHLFEVAGGSRHT